LSSAPFYLPPFFESRKMVCLTISTDSGSSAPIQKDKLSLDIHHPIFGGGVFQPGYLVPVMKIKEHQAPGPAVFVDHQYRYNFLEADDPDLFFLVVFSEHDSPVILYPHDIQNRKFITTRKITSYTAIFRPESIHENTEHLHAEIIRQMEILDNLRNNFRPRSSFLNHYLSAIPSRGDIKHLLGLLPIAESMGLSIESITHRRIEPSAHAYVCYRRTEKLKNYAWFLCDQTEPAMALSNVYEPNFIVISFACRDRQSSFFYENVLDYVCSYLNQHVWGPYRFINSHFGERLFHESNDHAHGNGE
jgi:hypothetical protein